MKRYIGVDIHTNSFTCCFLQDDGKEKIHTWDLQGGGLDEFLALVDQADEVALKPRVIRHSLRANWLARLLVWW